MSKLEVGDKIRILEDRLQSARVFKGDILEVVEVNYSGFATEAPRLERIPGMWLFDFEYEGTGWEKYEEAGE